VASNFTLLLTLAFSTLEARSEIKAKAQNCASVAVSMRIAAIALSFFWHVRIIFMSFLCIFYNAFYRVCCETCGGKRLEDEVYTHG
jgi:hypothetical protein